MELLKPTTGLGVVIPVGNDPGRLELALLGYAAQTDRDFDLHLVCDGPVPGVTALAARYGDRLRLQVHQLDLPGQYHPASARNLGLDWCRAERVILSDCDVVPSPHVIREHRRAGRQRTYVLGIRRRIPRAVVEHLVLPQLHAGEFRIEDLARYPFLGDQRQVEPAFRHMFLHLLRQEPPDPDHLRRYAAYFGHPVELLQTYWPAWLCWTFNVSFCRPGVRFDPGFDLNYGYEDLEFALRMLEAGYQVVVNPRIVVYHLDHQPRADESKKQSTLFNRTLQRLTHV